MTTNKGSLKSTLSVSQPRVNAALLVKFIGIPVRLVGRVHVSDGKKVEILTSDNAVVRVESSDPEAYLLNHLYEIIGLPEKGETESKSVADTEWSIKEVSKPILLQEFPVPASSQEFDMKAYDQLVELWNDPKYSSLF